MIKIKKYPDSINLIGIEFEGMYSGLFMSYLQEIENNTHMVEVTTDSSVHPVKTEEYDMNPLEVKTAPVKHDKLNYFLDLFNTKEQKGEYSLNSSTGLHFHISLNKTGFGSVCNRAFYDDMVTLFKEKYPKIWSERENNGYCRSGFRSSYTDKDHFSRTSNDRYHLVNYSSESHVVTGKSIETVEIRFYGGKYASVSELAQVIQDTINILDYHYRMNKIILTTNIESDNEPKEIYMNIEADKKYSKTIRRKYEYVMKKKKEEKSIEYIFKQTHKEPVIINY